MKKTLNAEAAPELAAEFLIDWWDVARCIPYEKNARKIPKSAVNKVAASIQEFGWRQPLILDAAGVIIAGHTRRLAALQLGHAQVPVHIAQNLSDEKIRALRLADNRTHAETDWDKDILKMELGELRELQMDLSMTGFDKVEIDELLGVLAVETDAPTGSAALTAKWNVQPGQVWQIGPHRLMCGDSTKPEDVARLLDGRTPALMVTDPPYGIELDSEWRDRAGINGNHVRPSLRAGDWGGSSSAEVSTAAHPAASSYMKHRTEGHENTSISGDTVADWSDAFALVPSLQVAYVWHASKFTREVLDGLLRIGFLYPQQLIWNKGHTVLNRTHYWYQHEPCWYVRKKSAPWYGKPGENSTIWDAPSPKFIMGSSDEAKHDHPTQKPIECMAKPIRNHTRVGEEVYEPFCGSGTTMDAAHQLGRVCFGMEMDPKFCAVILERLAAGGAHGELVP